MLEPQARYKSTMEGPVSVDIGPRAGRRRKVVALYGSYFLICVETAIQTYWDSPAGRIFSLVLLLTGVVAGGYGFVSLMGRTFVNAPNIREAAFDERQRQRRNDAIQRSLPAIGMLSALCLVYAMLAGTLGSAWFNATVVQAMLWAIFLLCVSLPTAIIAWTEPDPQALDEPFAANDAS